jgi:hypothetical protein
MTPWGVEDRRTWETVEAVVAKSTRQSYRSVFLAFVRFLHQSGRSMATVQVSDVLSFLQTLVDKKRAKTSIRVAHAALVHYFVLYNREDVIRSPVITFHVKGAQRLAPRVQKKVFVWDPEIPLNFLKQKPRPTLFLPAAREALLLLLLSTGICVSDAARLSKELSVVKDVCAIEYLEDRKTGPSPAQMIRKIQWIDCVRFVRCNIIYLWRHRKPRVEKRFCSFRHEDRGPPLTHCESG